MKHEEGNIIAISGRPFIPGMLLRQDQTIDRNGIVADITKEESYFNKGGIRWIRRELSTGYIHHDLSPEGWDELVKDFPD
ncbi:hypothetical protein GCM10007415_25420 [Parapedobacter pyrenivorans]|uniref:Uncharacterized protein n=1 Tax=Parapedobacter pyrenivorans TaxID=1305674 RepID=A0A917MBQ7_9SPHI|nr:hypothetical protein [Parapedobacter pyrenivorans]GGG89996.1 hypothetical protein GCM10007415_25420 [Parapedobacter pyrenivorans]